ncbi:MAG TPA: UvrB/UvrC motif-containing protein [Tepidisphaeraceae bacterium]|nr:UvrB/UvrC motif-containing protein [Tepidisphaeraceae bacterium]
MSEETHDNPEPAGQLEGKAFSKDITPLIKGWDYEPGTINVRKINGLDGSQKLQMRLDLGLLQMELTGRPDGARPHGFDSLLEYFESMLKEHEEKNGTELGFHLTTAQCQSLREEAVQYYHRYLSLFVLEDFPGVVRDTARNLRVLDLCGKYAIEEQDRLILEQYRPYITMMNIRASASQLVEKKQYNEAQAIVQEGLASLKEFFVRFGQEEAYSHSNEVRVLKRFAREIRKKLPIDPMEKLQNQLDRAVKQERYEDAAKIRDEIRRKSDQRA